MKSVVFLCYIDAETFLTMIEHISCKSTKSKKAFSLIDNFLQISTSRKSNILYFSVVELIVIQYAAFTLRHRFLHFFSVKSSSNQKPNGSFNICSSWGFRNTPSMLNLMKFWLRYLRLKTVDIFQKLISSSSFSLSIISVNSSANSKIRDIFEICLS